jgi:hypothetical protein
LTPSLGDNGPSLVHDDDAAPDLEPSSGHSFIVIGVNALMAAMTFGAVASMVMALGHHLMR